MLQLQQTTESKKVFSRAPCTPKGRSFIRRTSLICLFYLTSADRRSGEHLCIYRRDASVYTCADVKQVHLSRLNLLLTQKHIFPPRFLQYKHTKSHLLQENQGTESLYGVWSHRERKENTLTPPLHLPRAPSGSFGPCSSSSPPLEGD